MFAIVRLGNQQFKVKAGDFIRAPFQNHPLEEQIELPVVAFGGGKDFVFDSPKLKSSKVKAVIVRQSLSKKVLVFKKKRRKGYRRTNGHRQKITELKILELRSPEGQVTQVKWAGKSKTSFGTKAGPVKTSAVKSQPPKTQKATTAKKTSHKKVKKQAVKQIAKAKSSSAKTSVKAQSKKKTTLKKVKK